MEVMITQSQYSVALLLVPFIFPGIVHGQDTMIKAIAELPPEDVISFNPEQVVVACSEFLLNRDKENHSLVGAVLRVRGLAQMRVGRFDKAQSDFADLCRMLPNDAEAH